MITTGLFSLSRTRTVKSKVAEVFLIASTLWLAVTFGNVTLPPLLGRLCEFFTIVSTPFLPWVLDSCSTHLSECLHVRSLHQFWISLRLKIVLPIEEAVVMYSNNLRSGAGFERCVITTRVRDVIHSGTYIFILSQGWSSCKHC